MRALIQRVKRASVSVDGNITGTIDHGLLVFLGITHDDDLSTASWMAEKILSLRIFPDEQGKMNRHVSEVGGGLLVVSQFTLYADAAHGRRPSFSKAAPRAIAEPLYEEFVAICRQHIAPVATGSFGADMDVSLVNWGPVTIWLESVTKPGN
ncbi:D-tyrosyl-tRNA(Tyr) deacylase [Sulfobacillus thermosulfidooxidans DSM 9293]|uniref:D-aminoacyl-tRNA deacylase n=1 Tax=Sulfobacillus thermosulfidooxidans (strain DSM 9293 / VKM B-1269 / AT-1) TaxID=929705 RepID=A0A1W1WIS4_SULTA|nr:D-aminoacyl-tRNA deacylase [Sulfobacillus thermosulfidooxidans]SMC06049.1 D-tyrosyl-tRNA(Tyr) deacylase [Sulfobacillus thermosulfidooxidans DSM 9293]